MNNFTFAGRLAEAPENTKHGETSVTKFTLIDNEYAGKNDDGSERDQRKVAIQFTAFGGRGEAIANNSFKGDQLFVTARLENNNYTDGQGVERYGFNFVVDDFKFGAPGPIKREKLAEGRPGAG